MAVLEDPVSEVEDVSSKATHDAGETGDAHVEASTWVPTSTSRLRSKSTSTSPSDESSRRRAVSASIKSPDEDDRNEPQKHLNQRSNGDPVTRPRRSLGRVSYVEVFPQVVSDDESDGSIDLTDDEEADVYVSSASIESEVEEDSVLGNLVDHSSAVDEESADEFEEDAIEVDTSDHAGKSKPRRTTASKSTGPKAGKGIDFDLPPIDDVEDIFSDLATRALDLGLSDVLTKLEGRPLNVATMCSGTESPLLALDLLSKALQQSGRPPIHVRHNFSAEIEVFKQGYIERNFAPTKLFRDVRDFIPENSTTAVTAYGAEEPIPSNLDILIAGFVCKDLSRLNSRQKDLDSGGESGDTWAAIYSYAKRFRPRIVLLENVKSTSAVWEDLVSRWDKIDYEASWLICDTKRYYLPQTRERMYMIAIERSQYGMDVSKAVDHWCDLMQKLQRQCSSPYEAFLKNTLHDSSDHNALVSEPDWALCKLRYDHIRSDERLGILRPVTKWSENGTVRPPDIANRQWYGSQSSRVYDAIDVAHLQAAKKGYDSMHKMAVWDVSQNVDRFKADLGILPCITPGGCDFASNRQVALSGSQLLVLQGMPLSKLHFATETQRECQDLAGNAMSTTVIGASLISALISGCDSFRASTPNSQPALHLPTPKPNHSTKIVQIGAMKEVDNTEHAVEQSDLQELKAEAIMSSRLCTCEGEKRIAKSDILVCSSCNHTACAHCAGNPTHNFSSSIPRAKRAQLPGDFAQKWRPKLPTRLGFTGFPGAHQMVFAHELLDLDAKAYFDHIAEARIGSQYFCLHDLRRQDNAWIAVYNSPSAKLELRIGRDVEWCLFVTSPPGLPGNNPMRKLFEGAMARGKVAKSLLDATWEVYLPHTKEQKLEINGSTSRCSSWKSCLGLPDFKDETVPNSLQIRSNADDCQALVGEYEYLPRCGTACHSLYKRSAGPALYLFLDPSPIGKSEDDCFVFSHDCGLKHYSQSHVSLARMPASWRPWHLEDENAHHIKATVPGLWVPTAFNLTLAAVNLTASVPSTCESFANVQSDCSRAITILEARILEELAVESFDDYSWALQQIKHLPKISEWQTFNASNSRPCACAPVYPRVLWHVDDAGVASPHEDRKAAASFERSIKTRPPIFEIRAAANDGTTDIQVAMNISALVHRAKGRLRCSGPVTTTWRLVVDHFDPPPEPFPKFRLLSNSADTPFRLSPALSYLRNAQPKSLSWMRSQETGRSITVMEVEEAIDVGLGWRAEAQAHTSTQVRGGVLADLPSFGKTVTTIALIQSEFEECTPEVLLEMNSQVCAGRPTYIDTASTLIVSPPTIVRQWQTELKKFLGPSQFDAYNVLLVETFAQLRKLSIDDIRKSRIMIVSWSVFGEEEYIAHLARFTAMPEPGLSGRRAFDVWLRRALEEVPIQLETMNNTNYEAFTTSASDKLQARLRHDDYKVTLPIKINHGSAYQSFQSMKSSSSRSKAKSKPKFTARTKASGEDDHQVPLLHLFRFNRVVVDEYHYLNDEKKMDNVVASVCVKQVVAHKRWVLSGTPALGNFSDVDQIASYLGVKLGRNYPGDGMAMTQRDKAMRADQTLVEDFLARTEIMSRQWHQARHDRAQDFLDAFVRQNEACLGHIACEEQIVSVELNIGHHAVYLELSQHLIAQKMQIKKLNNKLTSDKIDRLNTSLNNSATAEEALLKSALLFETASGLSGLDELKKTRSEQRHSAESDLLSLMTGFEGLSKSDEISELYTRFKKDIKDINWLGDNSATRIARGLLAKAEKQPDRSAFPELKPKTLSLEKRNKLAKMRLSEVREIARELALRTRSERFIHSIQDLVQPLSEDVPGHTFKCNSPTCGDACVDPACNVNVQQISLVRATELGAIAENISKLSFGRKLDAIAHLIWRIPHGHQGLIFAPNDETIAILEDVFDQSDISYRSLRNCRSAQSSKIIEEFKSNEDRDEQGKVLMLNLGSEAAAGVNLINANHIIFISPLFAKTQYDYDSAMAQAIARSRRYGQEKKVHIYHVMAERTIDVDIMEHRHKRVDGIATSGSSITMPGPLAKKEKTQLVKNRSGEMALVPASWLVDASKRKMMNLEDVPGSFTSLISFSDTFKHEDD
ncbi:hypothetical protein EK21DRAFT_70985 [Setomelanomma holmii]|uniref:SNF2 N-terminal domain-containing protein n=1 Tax=Setomelanomma holmii TaxID=210430 RepID=A0A9P4H454_9PLEO|nr:hypothetical protein EK21DRAFT_70985 [Setomelanomma holmii]